MLVSDFSYDLPEDLIAQQPAPQREAARMLVLDRATGSWDDSVFEGRAKRFLSVNVCALFRERTSMQTESLKQK